MSNNTSITYRSLIVEWVYKLKQLFVLVKEWYEMNLSPQNLFIYIPFSILISALVFIIKSRQENKYVFFGGVVKLKIKF